jgi:hypothetical protein
VFGESITAARKAKLANATMVILLGAILFADKGLAAVQSYA